MLRQPKFFGVQEMNEGEAFDRAKCLTCDTLIEFDIHHLTGITVHRCQCHDWAPVARVKAKHLPPPMSLLQRVERLDKATRRRRVLSVLTRSEPTAMTVRAVSAASKICECTTRQDLLHLVETGIVRRKEIRIMEATRGGYFKHVFWRAA